MAMPKEVLAEMAVVKAEIDGMLAAARAEPALAEAEAPPAIA